MQQHHHPETNTILRNDVEIARLIQKGLPKDPTQELLASFGVYPLEDIRPDITPMQKATRSESPVHDVEAGVSRYAYTVEDKTPEELLASVPWQTATEARKAVVQWIDGLTAQIEALYPSAVKRRWEIEEAAARAVAENDGSATQRQMGMMTTEGAAKGRTALEHAAAVIANADRFNSIADQTNALFLATDKQLQDAQSPLEYAGIFEWAQAQAAPLAAAYGLEVQTGE